ncbi:MAG: MEDS domain-containing protein [Acidimicrobiia bacterium]
MSSWMHVAKIYDDDQDLVHGAGDLLLNRLAAGDAIVVVATPAHRPAFEHTVRASAVDVAADDRYLSLDAHQLLATFMVDGDPDPHRFDEAMRRLFRRAGPRHVHIFGEMVAVLWDEGNVTGAITLESLWNDLATEHDFSLYCAYPMASFDRDADLAALRDVCNQHSQVVAPRSYAAGPPDAPGLGGAVSASELFMPVPLAVGAARRFVRRALFAWHEDDLADNAGVVASELATNALLHSRSPFRVSVSRLDGLVTVRVQDAGDGSPQPRTSDPDVPGGQGLALVDAMSSKWGSERVADGKVVWAELRTS